MSEFESKQSRNQSSKLVHSVRPDRTNSHSAPIGSPLLARQQVLSNQAVQRLLLSGLIRAKLMINQPGDKYEQEADRVAEQIMRMPEPRIQGQVEPEGEEILQIKSLADQITPLIQRQVDLEEEEEKKEEEKEFLQTKLQSGPTPEVTRGMEARINSLRGGGQPLPRSVRNFFEPRFGYDFSQVCIHTDGQAAESAGAMNARAYTLGQHMAFAAGQYTPETTDGKKLLAHELTHVVQQKSRFCDSMIKSRQNFEPKSNQTPMTTMNVKSPSVQLVAPPLIQRECRYFDAGWIHPLTGRPGPAGEYCEILDEARARAIACPSNCFIYNTGPSSHPYYPIPGPGPCAHYVAHELRITMGPWYANCLEGYSVSIGQITQGRDRLPLTDAQVNDIWTNSVHTHSGVVERVDAERGRIRFRACSTGGHVYRRWTSDGYVWR